MNWYTDINALKKLAKNNTSTSTMNIALLGESATQFFNTAIKGYGANGNIKVNIYEADFDALEQEIYNPSSEIYKPDTQALVIQLSCKKFQSNFNKAERFTGFAQEQFNYIFNLIEGFKSKSSAPVILLNYSLQNDFVFGNYGSKLNNSLYNQLLAANKSLQEFAVKHSNVFIVDLPSIQMQLGNNIFFDEKLYVNAELEYSLDAVSAISKHITDILLALKGQFKKCVITDLDNTLWGGVIGDDGMENIEIGKLGTGKAFTQFQYFLKALTQRGIILAVCSKNTESIAKEPFEKHTDMVLRLKDVAIFVANWERKDDNIKQIKETLNIGYDSMVFFDDNPFERSIVKQSFPDITVPELPEAPEEWLPFIYSLNLFETTTISETDKDRTAQYQQAFELKKQESSFGNYNEFLESLQMQCIVAPFNNFNTPRVAQLIQRSNQFNLRTIRLTEVQVQAIAVDENYKTFTFSLSDKHTDHGLIGIVLLKKEENNLFIENWIMSCRVLKRGMENFILNTIYMYAQTNNFTTVTGEYIATPKNEIVKNLYADLQFQQKENLWQLDVADFNPSINFISTIAP